ncbi:hypothetical protein Ddc_15020 [Ditylenchus destructor]|nr:hypothetical protein Ddc_15020 [Ditylenchus destructor]
MLLSNNSILFRGLKYSAQLILPDSLLMSCSKPLPPFVCDSLYYLNRDQLERFSIISRPLKNFIERYFHSKPYRLFDRLLIFSGSLSMGIDLRHNNVFWHPNRDDYSAQQFLDGQACSIEKYWDHTYYSFAEMRPYLGPTVRIRKTYINVDGDRTYNPEQITEMESIAYLWSGYKLEIGNGGSKIGANDFLPILNSPTILQCRLLEMENAHFPFKDYKVLKTVKFFELSYYRNDDVDPNYLADFLEQPGVKPLVVLRCNARRNIDNLLDRLKEAFSFAVVPNAFKLVFVQYEQPLTEFRKTNKISGEILELKKGCPVEYQEEDWAEYRDIYTLERSKI